MKSAYILSALLALLLVAPTSYAAQSPARQRILMDAGWRFALDVSPGFRPAPAASVSTWRWKLDAQGASDASTVAAPGYDDSGWAAAAAGQDLFDRHDGLAWYRTTLPEIAWPGRTLQLTIGYDSVTIYLNGKLLLHHDGLSDKFAVPLDSAWNAHGPNILAILDQHWAGSDGIGKEVTLSQAPAPLAGNPASPAYDDHAWRIVHLPHDYVVEGKFDPNGDPSRACLPLHPAWYRKTFTLPAADKGRSVWIDFDGVYRDARVTLNGALLGEHQSGYTGFRYDISSVARYGGAPNVFAVHVDPRQAEGWWYEGGGIYRHVWLNVAAPVHVAPWGTFVASEVKNPLTHPSATLTVQTSLALSAGRAQTCRVISQIFDPAGNFVAAASTPAAVPLGSVGQPITQTVTVPHALLWSLDHPRMYRLHTELVQLAGIVDAVDTPFGIRSIRFDPNTGFYLNGRHVEIKGTCNHQDFAGVGIGVPDQLEYWRVKKLKEMGSNAWRMSHNPPTPSLLDACDREGMLVMDENRHLGDTYSSKSTADTPYNDMSDLDALILRDRNHPSVVMWSMCNEEHIQWSEAGARIFSAMRDETRRLDPTRPVTCAMDSDVETGISLVEALRGFNYHSYSYDKYHHDLPQQPLYGSENGSAVAARGVYITDDAAGLTSNYDHAGGDWAQTTQDAWQAIATRPFIAGGFDWTGFDYKGEPTPYGWPDINSNFGAMDLCGFPKDNYYYYKAYWGGAPLVHLFPHWNWTGMEGKPIDVWCYGNTAKVELFLNGKSLGVKAMPAYRHAEWSVPYQSGTLMVKGCDASGKFIATDAVTTTGAPAALRLATDRTSLAADGEDVTVVNVAVVDARGRVVPTAGNPVNFTVSGDGRVAGVGNGDPTDHESDKGHLRRAFNGRCIALVGSGDKPGGIHLTATSPGLAPASLEMAAR